MEKNTLLQVWPIPAFDDNYIWCIHDEQFALVVDPGQAKPVLEYLEQKNLSLKGILITHHHGDHTGGVLELMRTHGGAIPVYGPMGKDIPGCSTVVHEGDKLEITQPRISLKVSEVPGHTLSHVAYFANMQANVVEPMLFCGDTLFACGCGRLFEGSPKQMSESLAKFATLPKNTLVYCTHEYTLSNIRFALAVEPNNFNLISWAQEAQSLRKLHLPTLPTTIGQELQVNPFMRCDQPEVIEAARQASGKSGVLAPAEVLEVIRSWKDRF